MYLYAFFLLYASRGAIFQEDCKVESGPTPQIMIKLRLYYFHVKTQSMLRTRDF